MILLYDPSLLWLSVNDGEILFGELGGCEVIDIKPIVIPELQFRLF